MIQGSPCWRCICHGCPKQLLIQGVNVHAGKLFFLQAGKFLLQCLILREKIAARKAEQYQSKYAQPLADAKARVQSLSVQYNRDAAAYQGVSRTPDPP